MANFREKGVSPNNASSALLLIQNSGLFDADYYLRASKIQDLWVTSPIEHFLRFGADLGFDPHPLFSVAFYRGKYPHAPGNPLEHYLREGFRQLRNPHPLFDVAFYFAQRPDLEGAGVEPLRHYLEVGAQEGVEPSLEFSGSEYLRVHDDVRLASVNPLVHYVTHGWCKGPEYEQALGSNGPSRSQLVSDGAISAALEAEPAVKAIAFYLPQFHPIPENDLWWGQGFTEWTNVVGGKPRYEGHHQPHLPADLGFYDLRLPEVQVGQVDLAKRYGVSGFCFYFYWFDGKRLLERPIEQFADAHLKFPFCLCWANENWTRRWDGLDSEVLIGQNHSPEDDIGFISHISQYILHEDYIRIDSRPLIVVYRPSLLPNPAATAARWRTWCRENGVGEIFLAYTQSFESADPRDYGFDAAIEFPPNNSAPPQITNQVVTEPGFSGNIYDYNCYPERSENYNLPDYKLFRGVFPSWDNEARRKGRGTSFLHASPALYGQWLRNAARDTVARFERPDERLVFINAWNEWAEGAHLEPDQRYGHSWLEATRDALASVPAPRSRPRIAIVTHDFYRHGAQYIVLNLARVIKNELNYDVEIVTLGGGDLREEFAVLGTIHDLTGASQDGIEAVSLTRRLATSGCSAAICNTTVAGLFLGTLSRAGLRTVSLVHELPGVIASYKLGSHAEAIAANADAVVFPAEVVRSNFLEIAHPPKSKTFLISQGVYKRNGARTDAERQAARGRLRSHFGLPPDAQIILSVGFADLRKGFDLFASAGATVMGRNPNAVFIWVGQMDVSIEADVRAVIARSGVSDRFILPGFQAVTDDFYAGSDIYALTSREDPFPSVVMESLDAQVPVVCFRGSGGSLSLLEAGAGVVVEQMSADAMANAISDLLADEVRRVTLGRCGKAIVDREYSFRRYAHDILKLAHPRYQRVSVVAPNFNYSHYLPERLRTIDEQKYAPYELIILDDASRDGSLAVIDESRSMLRVASEVLVNEENSGSVFRQWRKGVERTRGDLVWIAEVDDLSDPEFLLEAVAAFEEDPSVVLSFTQSRMIDEAGRVIAPDYSKYVEGIHPTRWLRNYKTDGDEEIRLALAIKNTIPNVSAVLFERDALVRVFEETFEDIVSHRIAGDWVTYAKILELGRIAFSARPLNLHRRHGGGVTISSFDARQLREVIDVQKFIQERHVLSDGVKAQASAYVEELRRQFGL